MKNNIEKLEKVVADLQAEADQMKAERQEKRLKGLRQRRTASFDRQNEILCEYESCDQCVIHKSCGWCAEEGRCIQGRPDGPYNANCSYWNFALCEGGCRELRDCEACIAQPGCGFCTSSCECQQGHEEGPAFNNTCEEGWFHAENTSSNKCVTPQKWPGRWRRGTSMSTKICAAKQYSQRELEKMTPYIDRKNSEDVEKVMEKEDAVLFP